MTQSAQSLLIITFLAPCWCGGCLPILLQVASYRVTMTATASWWQARFSCFMHLSYNPRETCTNGILCAY